MPQVSLLFHDVYVRDPHESGFCSPSANRYKLSVPEFEVQLGATGCDEGRRGLSRRSSSRIERAKAEATLTFDDGGVSYYTLIAPRLEARAMRGYCFVTTDFIGTPGFLTADQIRQLDSRGHIIGAHSASHPPRFSALSDEEMHREWNLSRSVLEDIVGHRVSVASVPGGYFSRRTAAAAAVCGIRLLFNSEPVKSTRVVEGCMVRGRFTVRRGASPDFSRRIVEQAPWARSREWAAWNAKGLVKPLLGSSYPRIANWILGGV